MSDKKHLPKTLVLTLSKYDDTKEYFYLVEAVGDHISTRINADKIFDKNSYKTKEGK